MSKPRHYNVLRAIHARLGNSPIEWVITGSLGMALQGMDIEVRDIDIQTDGAGRYEIERCFSECVVQPARYRASERIRSHFGALEIDGIKVEIMGSIQKRLHDGRWEEPVQVEKHRCWVELEGMRIPVLSLDYEYQAYLTLGRGERRRN